MLSSDMYVCLYVCRTYVLNNMLVLCVVPMSFPQLAGFFCSFDIFGPRTCNRDHPGVRVCRVSLWSRCSLRRRRGFWSQPDLARWGKAPTGKCAARKPARGTVASGRTCLALNRNGFFVFFSLPACRRLSKKHLRRLCTRPTANNQSDQMLRWRRLALVIFSVVYQHRDVTPPPDPSPSPNRASASCDSQSSRPLRYRDLLVALAVAQCFAAARAALEDQSGWSPFPWSLLSVYDPQSLTAPSSQSLKVSQ